MCGGGRRIEKSRHTADNPGVSHRTSRNPLTVADGAEGAAWRWQETQRHQFNHYHHQALAKEKRGKEKGSPGARHRDAVKRNRKTSVARGQEGVMWRGCDSPDIWATSPYIEGTTERRRCAVNAVRADSPDETHLRTTRACQGKDKRDSRTVKINAHRQPGSSLLSRCVPHLTTVATAPSYPNAEARLMSLRLPGTRPGTTVWNRRNVHCHALRVRTTRAARAHSVQRLRCR
ncbi:hypothetical protein DPEC_G00272250 [Dallia pectoralis]|uniref:Uncharacterized protein n=1 Tax=Dallia pectoralis TaxID=75939 RepID=A0ACC2FQC0_DALPE|nr:hypothetical protein DPEC_G00272250 [Dallia pectoralis]